MLALYATTDTLTFSSKIGWQFNIGLKIADLIKLGNQNCEKNARTKIAN